MKMGDGGGELGRGSSKKESYWYCGGSVLGEETAAQAP